jgi:hypothetical protein
MKFPLFSIFFVATLLIGQMAPERIDPPANCKDGFLCGVTLQCACDQYCRMHQDETVLNGSCLDLPRGNGTRHKPEMKGMGGGAFALLTALCRIFTKGRCGEWKCAEDCWRMMRWKMSVDEIDVHDGYPPEG